MSKNYVILGTDGKVIVASGETGELRLVENTAHKLEIAAVIEARQALGRQLSQLLSDSGYVVAIGQETDVVDPGEDGEEGA